MSESSDKYERRVLHEFQRFVLSRTSTNVREDIYKNMIKNTVFTYGSNEGTLSYDELKKYIKKDYPLKNLPELHIDTAIEYTIIAVIALLGIESAIIRDISKRV